ncbi:MAG: hypothetical protein KAS23_14415 [Anaerohalosphaera sp.]|nr:hypothetical protein [Anaerohalosphaera sp.]
MPGFEEVLETIKSLGLTKGLFVVFFFTAHSYVFWLYRGRLKDRQKEIDRLASENHEYRDRFLKLLDKRFGF